MDLPGYQLDALRVHPGLVLAPMSGVTDSPFRRLVKAASGDAVGLVVSEFLSIEALTRRELRSMVRLAFHPEERPVGIQIFGADPVKMAEAAKIVEDAGADLVDINCGCPAPKVVKRGGGAGLLRTLPALADILRAVVPAVSIPVTIKIRNGWDEHTINAHDTLELAQDFGARAVAIHGRTRMQLYRGEADWDIVGALKQASRLPIIGSGDIATPADARRRLADTGCDGVMVGRGAIMNPWIFRQVADELAGRAPTVPTWRDKIALLERYRQMLTEIYPPKVLPGRMRMMLSRLIKGFPGAAEVRLTCVKMDAPEAMLATLSEACERLEILDAPAVSVDPRAGVAEAA